MGGQDSATATEGQPLTFVEELKKALDAAKHGVADPKWESQEEDLRKLRDALGEALALAGDDGELQGLVEELVKITRAALDAAESQARERFPRLLACLELATLLGAAGSTAPQAFLEKTFLNAERERKVWCRVWALSVLVRVADATTAPKIIVSTSSGKTVIEAEPIETLVRWVSCGSVQEQEVEEQELDAATQERAIRLLGAVWGGDRQDRLIARALLYASLDQSVGRSSYKGKVGWIGSYRHGPDRQGHALRALFDRFRTAMDTAAPEPGPACSAIARAIEGTNAPKLAGLDELLGWLGLAETKPRWEGFLGSLTGWEEFQNDDEWKAMRHAFEAFVPRSLSGGASIRPLDPDRYDFKNLLRRFGPFGAELAARHLLHCRPVDAWTAYDAAWREASSSEKNLLARFSRWVIDGAVRACSDPDPTARLGAYQRLACLRLPCLVPPLLRGFDDSDDDVKKLVGLVADAMLSPSHRHGGRRLSKKGFAPYDEILEESSSLDLRTPFHAREGDDDYLGRSSPPENYTPNRQSQFDDLDEGAQRRVLALRALAVEMIRFPLLGSGDPGFWQQTYALHFVARLGLPASAGEEKLILFSLSHPDHDLHNYAAHPFLDEHDSFKKIDSEAVDSWATTPVLRAAAVDALCQRRAVARGGSDDWFNPNDTREADLRLIAHLGPKQAHSYFKDLAEGRSPDEGPNQAKPDERERALAAELFAEVATASATVAVLAPLLADPDITDSFRGNFEAAIRREADREDEPLSERLEALRLLEHFHENANDTMHGYRLGYLIAHFREKSGLDSSTEALVAKGSSETERAEALTKIAKSNLEAALKDLREEDKEPGVAKLAAQILACTSKETVSAALLSLFAFAGRPKDHGRTYDEISSFGRRMLDGLGGLTEREREPVVRNLELALAHRPRDARWPYKRELAVDFIKSAFVASGDEALEKASSGLSARLLFAFAGAPDAGDRLQDLEVALLEARDDLVEALAPTLGPRVDEALRDYGDHLFNDRYDHLLGLSTFTWDRAVREKVARFRGEQLQRLHDEARKLFEGDLVIVGSEQDFDHQFLQSFIASGRVELTADAKRRFKLLSQTFRDCRTKFFVDGARLTNRVARFLQDVGVQRALLDHHVSAIEPIGDLLETIKKAQQKRGMLLAYEAQNASISFGPREDLFTWESLQDWVCRDLKAVSEEGREPRHPLFAYLISIPKPEKPPQAPRPGAAPQPDSIRNWSKRVQGLTTKSLEAINEILKGEIKQLKALEDVLYARVSAVFSVLHPGMHRNKHFAGFGGSLAGCQDDMKKLWAYAEKRLERDAFRRKYVADSSKYTRNLRAAGALLSALDTYAAFSDDKNTGLGRGLRTAANVGDIVGFLNKTEKGAKILEAWKTGSNVAQGLRGAAKAIPVAGDCAAAGLALWQVHAYAAKGDVDKTRRSILDAVAAGFFVAAGILSWTGVGGVVSLILGILCTAAGMLWDVIVAIWGNNAAETFSMRLGYAVA